MIVTIKIVQVQLVVTVRDVRKVEYDGVRVECHNVVDVYKSMCTSIIVSVSSRYVCEHMHTCVHVDR